MIYLYESRLLRCVVIIIIVLSVSCEACFRRVLAGKRVSSRFVKRFLICERIEDCQLECGEEKHFVCEGFNYRLDPTGRGKGECELLDVPLQRLDIGRDVYPDREYDYYERDRNTARTHCQDRPRYPDYGSKRPSYYHHEYDRRPGYNYYPTRRYDVGPYNYDRRPSYYDKVDYYDNRPAFDYDRRRPYDTPYHQSFHTVHRYDSHSHTDRNDNIKHGVHYLPPNPSPVPIFSPPYGHKSYYSKHNYGSIDNRKYDQANLDFKKHYGADFHRDYHRNPYNSERHNYYLPPKVGGTKDWGKYGGSYGNFGHNNDHSSKNEIVLNYWSLDNRNDHKPDNGYVLPPFKTGSYLPNTALEINVIQDKNPNNIGDNFILPVEPRLTSYNYLKEECSLRSATGFKLAKSIVKKFYAVPNIYECELLCFKERSFACSSYAFRYTISLSSPADNCYLSNKNYKELDYYTDLQPDRDFDIYTMNNMNKCVSPVIVSKDNSDCFWRVRSGQKLDHRVVKDSLAVNSIVDCQIECLKSRRFMCRVFSFRFGSPRSDRSFNNCQLSDWPYYEFDSRIDFVPESGFEIYERGSFGHGCEPYHFDIRGRPSVHLNTEEDQLCYIGFGSPARLLPEATKKALKVNDQLECKAECSKLREESILHCMSFSYRLHSYGGFNCFLSDIHQRDLLPHIDYIPDSHSRLYAWDNYNPQCTRLSNKRPHGDSHIHIGREEIYGNSLEDDAITALETWKAYSVSGWPCKRGYPCQKNLEAGFWFCKLEGGDEDAWDYCCRPDHQCGYSYGISYPWCYVGPDKTQWRESRPPLHEGSATHQVPQYGERPPLLKPPPFRPGFRPDLPPSPPQERPPQPSLNEYEMQFDEQFLAPPKPGGFGQPRHWPVSYLHKDRPPNITDSKTRLLTPGENKESKSKLSAIQSLIDIINSNELKNVQYQITNESNVKDDILFVKIPLPSNFTKQDKMDQLNNWSKPEPKLEQIDIADSPNVTRRDNRNLDFQEMPVNMSVKQNFSALQPTYRRGYITRTNVTGHRRSTL
ncbi:hypothetical protein WA026_011260 [Henosepilachna vigintioctopunctata]|uniref:Apple domain-containing protein n=1 Tax=Henosepilachna vigintioctopunctata TaxID=420089 RepID=A0AAW1U0S3_9CUCU